VLLCVLLAWDAASAQPLDALRPLFLQLSGSTLVQSGSPPVRQALGVRLTAQVLVCSVSPDSSGGFGCFALFTVSCRVSAHMLCSTHRPDMLTVRRCSPLCLPSARPARADPPAPCTAAARGGRPLRGLRRRGRPLRLRGGGRRGRGLPVHARVSRAGGRGLRAAAAERERDARRQLCARRARAQLRGRRRVCGRGSERDKHRGRAELYVLRPVRSRPVRVRAAHSRDEAWLAQPDICRQGSGPLVGYTLVTWGQQTAGMHASWDARRGTGEAGTVHASQRPRSGRWRARRAAFSERRVRPAAPGAGARC